MKPLNVPDKSLLGIFSPSAVKIDKSEEEIIDEAFSDPFNSSRLSEILEGCRDVLILVDDYTRTTPTQKILPGLIKELEHGGIKPEGKAWIHLREGPKGGARSRIFFDGTGQKGRCPSKRRRNPSSHQINYSPLTCQRMSKKLASSSLG
jgi:hypothetical protein